MHCSRTPISATPADPTGFEGDGTQGWRRVLGPHPEEAAKQPSRRMDAGHASRRTHASRVYPTCMLKAPISGKTRDRCVLLSMRTGRDMNALERLCSYVAANGRERR